MPMRIDDRQKPAGRTGGASRRPEAKGREKQAPRQEPAKDIRQAGWKDWLQRFLGWFGLRPPVRHRSEGYMLPGMDEGIEAFVRELAAQEKRPVEDVTADLLVRGLAQRRQEEDLSRRWAYLSAREQQVTALSCLGYTNGQIAVLLKVAKETVKTHSTNAQRKFDVRSKAELTQLLGEWDFSEYDPDPRDDRDA